MPRALRLIPDLELEYKPRIAGIRGFTVTSEGVVYMLGSVGSVLALTEEGQVVADTDKGFGIRLETPWDLALWDDTVLYAMDGFTVRGFSLDGQVVVEWGERGSGPGQFKDPKGIALSDEGDLFLADSANHRIQHFGFEGSFVQAWGEQGKEGPGKFHFPMGVAVDSELNVYVTDQAGRVQQYDVLGEYLMDFKAPGGQEDGRFGFPMDVEVAPDGSVYVADRDRGIFKFSADGEPLGHARKGTDPGLLPISPTFLAFDSEGRLWVSSFFDDRLIRFTVE